jgi:hypothetical protein
MTKTRLVTLGLFAATLAATTALAQTTPTDGLKFDDGFPKNFASATPGLYWTSASGGVDTAKYPNGKIDGTVCFMEMWQIDKDGKEVAGTRFTFKGTADPEKNNWSVNTQKTWNKDTGKETDFAGYPPGNYKLRIQVKFKETPTSQQRDAILEATLEIKAGSGGDGPTAGRLGPRMWFVLDRRRLVPT